jgi:class 3 adenylate cyclase
MMREALEDLNVTLRAQFGVTLENRTGVNTGEVVTGDTGDSQRLATGDTVNVAARLEQAAPAGEVLIGESTYRLVRDAIEIVPVEPLELKGKPEPMSAYRLLSVTAAATSTEPASRPLVGRGPRDSRPRRGLPPFGRRTRGSAHHAIRRGRRRQEPAHRGVRE